MGIYDRDYYRGESDGFFAGWGRWGTCVWLIAATCVVFLAQIVTRDADPPGITAWLIYDYRRVLDGEVWRLFTPVFLHDPNSLFHLAFNMLTLYWFGRVVEQTYGSREFLAFYLTAGVVAYLGNFAAHAAGLTMPARALGASGAVTAVLVLFALNFPRQQIMLFFVIPVPAWGLVLLYVGLDVLGLMGAGKGGIGYLVHLCGAAFAFAYFAGGWRLTVFGTGPRQSETRERPRPRLRVIPADDEDAGEATPLEPRQKAGPSAASSEQLEARLDQVLEKVSRQGQEGLTAEERGILFRASEIYKNRRK